jgi:MFS family permease
MDVTYASVDVRSTTQPMLSPIMAFVFIAYLIVGLALPVLPLYVRNDLRLSNLIVGLVAGMPFAAALLSRVFAGRYADGRGAKPAMVVGLLVAAMGGLFYLLSLCVQPVDTSISILLLGRACLGIADSFVITGALSWGLAVAGAQNTGKVMAWVGTALYGAFAIGAPVGASLFTIFGFIAVALATAILPIGALIVLVPFKVTSLRARTQPAAILSVIRAVWQPGIALALSGVGFGAITAFIALFFADHAWTPVWPAFSALSVAFMCGRLLFGGLPDRIGGAKVALVCVVLEGLGLIVIWLAPTMLIALAGVALSGFGYSLVFPGLGVEALCRAPAHNRGLAMGMYTAFLDISLGISGPLLGWVAGKSGLTSIFLISSVIAFAAAMPLWLLRRSTEPQPLRTEVNV